MPLKETPGFRATARRTPAGSTGSTPSAAVAADARVLGASVVGANARVGEGATLEDSILWPGAEIASRSLLKGCIVRGSQMAAGSAKNQDF